MNEALFEFYSGPQKGGYLPVFSGTRRQLVGGGFFGTLARFAMPLLKNIGKRLLGATSRGATQYLSGNKSFKNAMVDELGTEAIDLAKEGWSKLKRKRQGGGVKKKKRRKSINKSTIFDKS